jgi:hypothetical protein
MRYYVLCMRICTYWNVHGGKSSRNHRTVRGTTETCRHQVNERSAWLPQRSMKVNWQPHIFHLHNKKEKKSVLCKSESVIIESTVIGFTIINDALLRTLYAYMYVLECARIINLFPHWSTDSPTFSIFTIKKKRNPFFVKVNQFTTKFKSIFDSHYQTVEVKQTSHLLDVCRFRLFL